MIDRLFNSKAVHLNVIRECTNYFPVDITLSEAPEVLSRLNKLTDNPKSHLPTLLLQGFISTQAMDTFKKYLIFNFGFSETSFPEPVKKPEEPPLKLDILLNGIPIRAIDFAEKKEAENLATKLIKTYIRKGLDEKEAYKAALIKLDPSSTPKQIFRKGHYLLTDNQTAFLATFLPDLTLQENFSWFYKAHGGNSIEATVPIKKEVKDEMVKSSEVVLSSDEKREPTKTPKAKKIFYVQTKEGHIYKYLPPYRGLPATLRLFFNAPTQEKETKEEFPIFWTSKRALATEAPAREVVSFPTKDLIPSLLKHLLKSASISTDDPAVLQKLKDHGLPSFKKGLSRKEAERIQKNKHQRELLTRNEHIVLRSFISNRNNHPSIDQFLESYLSGLRGSGPTLKLQYR